MACIKSQTISWSGKSIYRIQTLTAMTKMKFELDEDQVVVFNKWRDDLDLSHPMESGAIGGRYELSFTITSIGIIVTARSACGKLLDLTTGL